MQLFNKEIYEKYRQEELRKEKQKKENEELIEKINTLKTENKEKYELLNKILNSTENKQIKESDKKRISISIPKDILEEIDSVCKKQYISRSALFLKAILQELKK